MRTFVSASMNTMVLGLALLVGWQVPVLGNKADGTQESARKDDIFPVSLTMRYSSTILPEKVSVLYLVYKSLDYWRVEWTGSIFGEVTVCVCNGGNVWYYYFDKDDNRNIKNIRFWNLNHKDIKNKKLAKFALLGYNTPGIAFIRNPTVEPYKADSEFLQRMLGVPSLRSKGKAKVNGVECMHFSWDDGILIRGEIWFGCSDGLLRQQVIHYGGEHPSLHKITVTKVMTKVKLKGDEFMFQPPPGAAVRDLTESIIRGERARLKESEESAPLEKPR